MLQVTFNEPIIIDAANLHSLLSLANAPAIVVPYGAPVVAEPAKRVRKAKVEPETPSTGESTAPATEKAPRKRATKAEMEARKAAAAGAGEAPKEEVKQEAPKEEPKEEPKEPAKRSRKAADKKADEPKGDAPKADELLERFAKLIDSDFAQAKGVLDGFGVNRFSDLPADQLAAFAAKLTELGV